MSIDNRGDNVEYEISFKTMLTFFIMCTYSSTSSQKHVDRRLKDHAPMIYAQKHSQSAESLFMFRGYSD